ncbi:hypothetical protein [Cyclobacterium xiamenense]|uniref:hypothetical protein n=1 Tax=Cyclobacterium xiamenense TaxID=1297121 RepID=UPI0035D119A6
MQSYTFRNLSQALQEAKLRYLETTTGRALRPDYWAGLVLLGDPVAIAGLRHHSSWKGWQWGIAGLLLVALITGRKMWLYRYLKIANKTTRCGTKNGN